MAAIRRDQACLLARAGLALPCWQPREEQGRPLKHGNPFSQVKDIEAGRVCSVRLEREKVSRPNYIIKLKTCPNTQHSFAGHSQFLHSWHCSLVPLTWGVAQRQRYVHFTRGFWKYSLVWHMGFSWPPCKPCAVRYDRSKGKARWSGVRGIGGCVGSGSRRHCRSMSLPSPLSICFT